MPLCGGSGGPHTGLPPRENQARRGRSPRAAGAPPGPILLQATRSSSSLRNCAFYDIISSPGADLVVVRLKQGAIVRMLGTSFD